jgi:hypothetical protein
MMFKCRFFKNLNFEHVQYIVYLKQQCLIFYQSIQQIRESQYFSAPPPPIFSATLCSSAQRYCVSAPLVFRCALLFQCTPVFQWTLVFQCTPEFQCILVFQCTIWPSTLQSRPLMLTDSVGKTTEC